MGVLLNLILGRGLGTAVDRCLYPRRGQALSLRELSDDQRQAGTNKTMAAERRGLRLGRLDAARSTKDGIRWWRTTAVKGRRTRYDHGPTLRRCLLCWHRYRS